jgi:hypothetical protein
MSARLRFWLILGAAVLLAIVAWGLALPRLMQTNAELADELDAQRKDVLAATPGAIGTSSLVARDAVRDRVDAMVAGAEKRFASVDAKYLDRWFDDVGRKWTAQPSPAEFKRYYLLEVDALRRELTGLYEKAELGPKTAPLVEHSWMGEDETPDINALRWYQREFRAQGRILRALAKAGVWLESPMVVGRLEALGGVAVARLFDDLPVKLTGLVRPQDLSRGLHAFDVTGKQLGIRVRNVEVAAPLPSELDAAEIPPLRLTFELEVLDFKPEGLKG